MTSTYSFSGQLLFKAPAAQVAVEEEHLIETNKLFGEHPVQEKNSTPKIGVDWNSTIKFGANNKKADKLNFTFDMIDFKTARLVLTDANSERFSVPPEVLPKPDANMNMRLDMVGFQFHPQDN